MAVPGRVGPVEKRQFVLEDDWAVLAEATESQETQELTRRITTFRRTGETYRRAFEEHRLQLKQAEEVLGMAHHAGFEATQLASYGAVEFPPGYTAFLARKV
jgi:hypothetical protein